MQHNTSLMNAHFDPARYAITIRKGEFEGETCFEARVLELPDIAEYADTADEAYALAIDTIETARRATFSSSQRATA